MPIETCEHRAPISRPKPTLRPVESYAAPASFVAVYHGDFYEPLRMLVGSPAKGGLEYSQASARYNVSWCGWATSLTSRLRRWKGRSRS